MTTVESSSCQRPNLCPPTPKLSNKRFNFWAMKTLTHQKLKVLLRIWKPCNKTVNYIRHALLLNTTGYILSCLKIGSFFYSEEPLLTIVNLCYILYTSLFLCIGAQAFKINSSRRINPCKVPLWSS